MIKDPGKPYQTIESVIVQKASLTAEIRDYGEGPQLVLSLVRGNSRAFDFGTARFLQLLRECGITVLVNISGVEITLEQFESSGAWGVKKSSTVTSPQGRYNVTLEMKRLQGELLLLKENDSTYFYKVQRLNHLKSMIESVKPAPTPEDIKLSQNTSDLAEMIGASMLAQFTEQYTPEQIAAMTFDELKELSKVPGLTKVWDRTVSVWNTARVLVKEKTQNAQQPVVGGGGDTTSEVGSEQRGVDSVIDPSGSD